MENNVRLFSSLFEDPYMHPNNEIIYVEEAFPSTGADLEEFYSTLDLKCDCSNECIPGKCACVNEFGVSYVNGVLTEDKLFSQSILECTHLCKCFPFCSNVITQRGPSKYLLLKNTEDRGYGLFCTRPVEKGTFICEYAGEIIGENEAMKRFKLGGNPNYILLLREYCSRETINLYIDAKTIGNIGRYINHSCSPNCVVVPVRVGSPVPKLAIFASRLIKEAEEITYSYGTFSSTHSNTPCSCGFKFCQGFLPQDVFDNEVQ